MRGRRGRETEEGSRPEGFWGKPGRFFRHCMYVSNNIYIQCEAQNSYSFPRNLRPQSHCSVARPQRFLGPGAQTLHPASVSRLRSRLQSSRLFTVLHKTGAPTMYVRAKKLGSPDQASSKKRPANRRVALPDWTGPHPGPPPKPRRHEDFKRVRYLNKVGYD